ncbi:MAG: DUF5069 domain-containing protein [Candidatus Poribacteria bacterium]|nr:DUF5069 domain-containing protein [Candidatus Poribacteria bacterium]
MAEPNVSNKLKSLALDLAKVAPRSPRVTLGGYVVVARTLDKCRAVLNGSNGLYNYGGLLDRYFLNFTEIDPDAFKAHVATGASDEEVAAWIGEHARAREAAEIVAWNNQMRELKISELPTGAQQFMERYVPQVIPSNRRVYVWFDVYDIEEGHL